MKILLISIVVVFLLNALMALDVAGRPLPSNENWITSSPNERNISMDITCKRLLVCYQSYRLTTGGPSKLGRRFRPGKLLKNGCNERFSECAEVIEGKEWHGLIIGKGKKNGDFNFASSLGFDGIFNSEQINNNGNKTEIILANVSVPLLAEFRNALPFGPFLEDFGPIIWAFDFLPFSGQNGTRRLWKKKKCIELTSLTTTPSFSDIDCGRVLANDRPYIDQRTATNSSPVTVADPGGDGLAMDCESIRARHMHFGYHQHQNAYRHRNGSGNAATDYPLAFIRPVYQSYLFIEMEFATSYAAQNWYCYAIDKKSSQSFRDRIHSLSKCFPNVLVTLPENEHVMDSWGHNYMKSCLECMQILAPKPWNYVILLQNDDVQIKTNDELIQIFKWMNGVNDIQYTHIGSKHVDFAKNNWHLDHLKLFRNATKNRADLMLQKNKGQPEMSLTRAFVDWLLNELDVSIMLDQLNSYAVYNDEYFMPTLAANEFLDAPGGFTQACFHKALAPGFTRITIWLTLLPMELCHSGIKLHSICILGLKDLVPHLNGTNNPFMFANKMRLDKDAEAVQCWYEQMFNRTYLYPTLERLNQSFYTELPQVRYNTEKKSGGNFSADAFNCRYAFIDMVSQYQELSGKY